MQKKKLSKILALVIGLPIALGLISMGVSMSPLTTATKADAARQTVAAQAAAAEAVAYGAQRVVFRYVDKEADVICYYVISDRSNVTGGIDCISLKDLTSRGLSFVLTY